MQVSSGRVKIFKIRNRRGFACICLNHLTEGKTIMEAYRRMIKALKRSGLILKQLEAKGLKRLLKNL